MQMNLIIFRFLTSETWADFYFPWLFLQLIKCCWIFKRFALWQNETKWPTVDLQNCSFVFCLPIDLCSLSNSLYCFGQCQYLIKPDAWQHSTRWKEKKLGKEKKKSLQLTLNSCTPKRTLKLRSKKSLLLHCPGLSWDNRNASPCMPPTAPPALAAACL